jgi:hypothetical protein
MIRENDGSFAGHHAIKASQSLRASGQKDAGQIIVLENERPFPASRADDDLFGANPKQSALVNRGQQIAFIQAEGDCVFQDASARMIGELDRQRLNFGQLDAVEE